MTIFNVELRFTGKSTGIVTTSRMTHATPAAMYAVATNRDWETDTLTPAGCIDIADQLITLNSDINVILGGGSSYFIPSDGINPVTNINDSMRTDDKDLIQISRLISERFDTFTEAFAPRTNLTSPVATAFDRK
ncbi:PPBT-like protein [Mya arenaria]|uniref:Alkaline phosphatase, tissue-nonspecific isozyme n=1 Tax=Mya arenaria TaxID=6604 RepID=A0ABY7EYD9_MYAAR|nr:PPBT-like protein [Mya arenaria]